MKYVLDASVAVKMLLHDRTLTLLSLFAKTSGIRSTS